MTEPEKNEKYITIVTDRDKYYGVTPGMIYTDVAVYHIYIEESFEKVEEIVPFCPTQPVDEQEKWRKLKEQKEFRKRCKRGK